MIGSTTDRIERQVEIAAPVERVWRALTDYREFGSWFLVRLERPFVLGETAVGQIAYPGYEHLRFEALVVAMDRPRSFAFRWHPYAVDPDVDYSNEPTTLVEFTLTATATGTLLKVCESGFDAIPAERRDLAFRMNDGGWRQQMENVKAWISRG
ncbi:MAG: SRPBCC family protein [Phycisphaerae bacterium]|jgi:uncharacterized protein YndB with AHSA1/START domain|nr:SRPBCC family protein [Phycisphaerae bacterium]